jgi:acetyl esterase/lipase
MKDILDDAFDAYGWCRENLGRIVGRHALDEDRYILAGESAGGYIALMLAHRLSQSYPRPRAIISCYGPTDLVTGLGTGCEALGWWPSGEFTQHEIDRHVADHDPSHAIALCPEEFHLEVETLREQWQDSTVIFSRRLRLQYETTKYLTTSGKLMSVVLRTEEHAEGSEEKTEHAKLFSPLYLIDQAVWYPPTYFFNGTTDAAVPYKVHLLPFKAKLEAKGIPVGVSLAEGMGHGFDNKFTVSRKAAKRTSR